MSCKALFTLCGDNTGDPGECQQLYFHIKGMNVLLRNTTLITRIMMKSDKCLTRLCCCCFMIGCLLWITHVLSSQCAVCDTAMVWSQLAWSPWCWKPAGEEPFGGGEEGSQAVHLTFTGLCPHIWDTTGVRRDRNTVRQIYEERAFPHLGLGSNTFPPFQVSIKQQHNTFKVINDSYGSLFHIYSWMHLHYLVSLLLLTWRIQ